jgi:ubiquinol-cytochrome c reductase cytochrome b subunit
LVSAVPYVGSSLVRWVWGGFSVDNATLGRFYSLHFLLPLFITALSGLHIFYLHFTGSNNPLGLNSSADKVIFHSYFSYKDLLGFRLLIWVLTVIVLFYPTVFFEADNFIPANSLVTPSHILPE